ncbi:MAG: ATP-dependent Clp protease ATP-binding subunit [Candidatus Kerfeldbacteria bacterium]|nr:ATP-dependent Clp protease ATP-binding subunit [Candidatus Kerfeldbacteria bacterium]
MNQDILEKFSSQLREVFARSIDTAWELQEEHIPPVFILWSIAMQEGSTGADILKKYNISAEHIREQFPLMSSSPRTEQMRTAEGTKTVSFLWPEFSTHTKRVIERGAVIAFELQHMYIGTEHVLLALIERADERINAILAQQKVQSEELTQHIIMMMRSAQAIHDIQQAGNQHMNEHSHSPRVTTQAPTQRKGSEMESETPALDAFGVDLTSTEQQQRLSPVVGRTEEIDRLIHVLSRKTKNNPVLVGEPGVGKTAIVEGLAQRIVRGTVPDALIGKRIVALDLTLMISGTMYRGDYEARMKSIIEELKEHTDIIVFIDELHTIVGAGNNTQGSLDTAHMLKPALARGELRCIGATTTEEYRKHIEADSALERRFQPITIAEPSEKETLDILKGIEQHYADFHRVVYTEEAIRNAVDYAARYLPDRHFPDKAIDILDEAGAMKRGSQPSSGVEKRISEITAHLRDVRKRKILAIKNEQFQDAIDLKKAEDQYAEELAQSKLKHAKQKTGAVAVTQADIASVVARMCRVPVEYMNTKTSAVDLEKRMSQEVFGQKEAIHTVVSIIERSLAGLHNEHKPLASILFLGPSGVGKTLLAQTLAQELFHSHEALLHMNMAEFSEGFAVTKMLGAPAGYVGHKDTVKFIDHIRRHPYSVVLFDEIEKAHPDVVHLIIDMIDRGRVTDSTGRVVMCNHVVFIITSHIAEDTFTKRAQLGFEFTSSKKQKEEAKSAINVQEYFQTELLNVLDAHITFAPLSKKAMCAIVQRAVAALNTRLIDRNVSLSLSAQAIEHIAVASFSPDTGARGVKQIFAQMIEQPLANQLLQEKIVDHDRVRIDVMKEKLHWTIQHKETKKKGSSQKRK